MKWGFSFFIRVERATRPFWPATCRAAKRQAGRLPRQASGLSHLKNVLLAAAVLLSAGKIFAADFSTDFSLANKLYAEGKFSDAANLYEKIIASGKTSPNLLFNYGNAEFKSGNLGKAIAAFRRAELLAPRDSDVRANLDFVRKQVQGSTIHESWWSAWLGQLTLNEWAVGAAIAFWLTFILFAAKQIVVARASRASDEIPKHTRGTRVPLVLRRAISICAVLTILFGAAAGLQAAEHFSRQSAVVILDNAIARSGPFDDAQKAFTVHDGAELSVLNRHGDWVQAADGSGNIGWLETKQVEILPGA